MARPSDSFWDAVRTVESGGDDDAVGDNGKAIGPLQIWESYYNDAVQHDKSLSSGGKTWNDCKGPGSFEYSKRVANAYMERYATERRLGHPPTNEDFARIHNGGPNGFKKDATKKYWDKVRSEL